MNRLGRVCLLALGLGGMSIPAEAVEAQPSAPRVNPAAVTTTKTDGPRGAEILARAWPDYRKRFITPEGRVVDNGNGGISHSEGQGYGMLLALAVNDRETFDAIWNWTVANLAIRPDGLAAWRWAPGSAPNVTDPNNASDGDLLIAWALAEAGLRWNAAAYTDAMRKITKAIFAHNVIKSRVGPILLPGASGFGAADQPDGPVVNLSYWVFPAIDRLQQLDPSHDWAGLRRSGLALLQESRFGPRGLPPEWISVGAKTAQPAAKFERTFGYNAVRIPLYLAWSTRVPTDRLQPFPSLWNPVANLGPFVIAIDDGIAGAPLDAPGYRMVFALVHCIVNKTTVSPATAAAANALYYPATLGLLSTLAISERRPQCL